jgi:opacity protein-like surface antigen
MKFSSKILGLALAGVLVSSSVPASAQVQTEPYYLGLKLLYSRQPIDVAPGAIQVNEANWVPETATQAEHNFIPNFLGHNVGGGDFDGHSMGGAVALGYDFYPFYQNPLRLELEFAGRGKVSHDFSPGSSVDVVPVAGQLRRGGWAQQHVETTVYSIFANTFYDFRNDTAFTPYLGAGIGGAYIKGRLKQHTNYREFDFRYGGANQHDAAGPALTSTSIGTDSLMTGDSNEWNFAWNLSAGLSYQISDNMLLDMSYRYADFGEIELATDRYFWFGGETPDGNNLIGTEGQVRSIEGPPRTVDIRAHEFMIGLRFTGF